MPATLSEHNATGSMSAPEYTQDFAVEMIGTTPPPYGGVTIHCARLLEWLQTRGINARLWDLDGRADELRNVLPYAPASLRTATNGDGRTVVHWHKIPDKRTMIDFARTWYSRSDKRARRAITVLSVHNSRLTAQVESQPFWNRLAIRWFMRRCDAVVFDSAEGREQGIALGCLPERCHAIPAFIPPSPDSVTPENLPAELREFIAAHQPVLAAVGWTIDFHDGVDIYGMDLLVEAIGKLVRTRPEIGLVFRLSHPSRPEYFATLTERTRELGIEKNILWYSGPLESAAAIWNAADLFIRPTCTDGDAVSVGEALHLGVPVVASDAVVRPGRCRLFRNRDVRSLVDAVSDTLTDCGRVAFGCEAADGIRSPNHADDIIAVYHEALADSSSDDAPRL